MAIVPEVETTNVAERNARIEPEQDEIARTAWVNRQALRY